MNCDKSSKTVNIDAELRELCEIGRCVSASLEEQIRGIVERIEAVIRPVETSPKPARDADHCDFPDCEKHWSAFARMLSGLLVECRPYVVKADVGQQAHPHLLLHKIDVAVKNSPLEPFGKHPGAGDEA